MAAPLNLRSIVNRSRTVTVTLPDDLGTVTVVYKAPTARSAGAMLGGASQDTSVTPIEKLARDLAEQIESWDVTGDDGEVVKPTYELLSQVDVGILNVIAAAIIEHTYPPKKPAGS